MKGTEDKKEITPAENLLKRPAQRIQKKSILTVADELKEKYRLPENRQPLSLFDQEHPPNIKTTTPIIKTSLIEDINKKNSDVVTFM